MRPSASSPVPRYHVGSWPNASVAPHRLKSPSEPPAWNAKWRFPLRPCRRQCPQTAACSDNARRWPATSTARSRLSAPPQPTRRAPANVAPAVMPTKILSCCAKSRLHRSTSAFAIGMMRWMTFMSTASAVSFGMKSGVQPLLGVGFEGRVGGGGGPVGVALLRNFRFRTMARPAARTRPTARGNPIACRSVHRHRVRNESS